MHKPKIIDYMTLFILVWNINTEILFIVLWKYMIWNWPSFLLNDSNMSLLEWIALYRRFLSWVQSRGPSSAWSIDNSETYQTCKFQVVYLELTSFGCTLQKFFKLSQMLPDLLRDSSIFWFYFNFPTSAVFWSSSFPIFFLFIPLSVWLPK